MLFFFLGVILPGIAISAVFRIAKHAVRKWGVPRARYTVCVGVGLEAAIMAEVLRGVDERVVRVSDAEHVSVQRPGEQAIGGILHAIKFVGMLSGRYAPRTPHDALLLDVALERALCLVGSMSATDAPDVLQWLRDEESNGILHRLTTPNVVGDVYRAILAHSGSSTPL